MHSLFILFCATELSTEGNWGGVLRIIENKIGNTVNVYGHCALCRVPSVIKLIL